MLERIREGSQGIVAKSILGLVILTFAVSGIGSYINSQADTALAVVNDVEIGQSAFEQAYQSERNRMQSQYGEMIEQLMLDDNYVANFKKGVLERLIIEELQRQEANDLGIRVGDEQIRTAIRQMPEFQQDGQFDNDRYLALLRQAGFQPKEFKEYVREQMSRTQYVGAVSGSEFVLPSEEKVYKELSEQVRSFDMVTISAAGLRPSIKPEQTDLDAFYAANKYRYQTQPKVAVDYLVIDSAELTADIDVSEQEVEAYYNDSLAAYTQEAQRRLSHILIETGDDAEAAKATIMKAQQELNAGKDFAELAKLYSTDTFSGENGGDLEWVDAGVMGDEFDEAAAKLTKVGDVTDVVETEYGYHLIKLTDFKAAVVQPLAEVKDDILASLKQNKITEIYLDAQTRAVETSYEIADTLIDAAEVSGLKMQSTGLLSRAQLPAILLDPKVTDKLFDEEFINEGLNSDLIELNDDKSIIVRVNEYEAAKQQSLDDVLANVTAAVVAQQATELADVKATEILTKLNAGEALSSLGLNVESQTDVARYETKVDVTVRDKVFALAKPVDGTKEFSTVSLNNGDAVVISLNSVSQKASEGAEDTTKQQVEALVTRITAKAYIDTLKATADIEINL
ncbi:SurA N-terminal domain-containing protein [uncultured Psychrosphaera sp.]|uniref:SurA N-terminal domain-containing protein n=1 Tax=uncultured Psychrosphaera sp. TaxID=1403522 RepID=UPI00260F48F9|nr:SurA N-terminal domain-containing protein [uncultured Psychrosphaera sp.]